MEARRRTEIRGTRARQRGVAIVLIVAGMAALLLMAGLALDGGHMMLNKTRLQNTVDAAALAAAKRLDETLGDTTQATPAALAVFGSNTAAAGNNEMQSSYAAGDIQVTVQYSQTLHPFTVGAPAGPYVRVIATGFVMPAWLISLAGINQKTVAATAVAGPSPVLDLGVEHCNLAPMMVCGDPSDPDDPDDPDDSIWGYEYGAPDVLKTSASGGDTQVGPGNFQLIRLGDSQGGADIRRHMAGDYDACLGGDDSDVIETEPGNTVGPVVQGLNTRFGEYLGPMGGTQSQYPPDVVTTGQNPDLNAERNEATGDDDIFSGSNPVTTAADLDYDFDDYTADVAAGNYDYPPSPAGIGVPQRRVIAIPVGDCSSTTNGQGQVPLLGYACYFLLQPVKQHGNEAHVFGQFVDGCRVNGNQGPAPGTGPGPYRIQLYDDADNADS